MNLRVDFAYRDPVLRDRLERHAEELRRLVDAWDEPEAQLARVAAQAREIRQ